MTTHINLLRQSSTYHCARHPEGNWTQLPCQEPECRHERFARFLRELAGLPTERAVDEEQESERGTP